MWIFSTLKKGLTNLNSAHSAVFISLKLSCYVGRRLGLNVVTEEIALVPFRCKKLKIKYFLFSREATLELALLVRASIHLILKGEFGNLSWL